MMTAMEVGHLPLALVRSGRVELWLEMKLPDEESRRTILERQLAKGTAFDSGSYGSVVSATNGFTGADLKRVVEDAKSLLAFDRASEVRPESDETYLLRAVESVALNKKRYAEAELGARHKSGPAPHPFALFSAAHGASFSFGHPVISNDD
jgi:ATP-dependent 26S proteasome regulatory subunit